MAGPPVRLGRRAGLGDPVEELVHLGDDPLAQHQLLGHGGLNRRRVGDVAQHRVDVQRALFGPLRPGGLEGRAQVGLEQRAAGVVDQHPPAEALDRSRAAPGAQPRERLARERGRGAVAQREDRGGGLRTPHRFGAAPGDARLGGHQLDGRGRAAQRFGQQAARLGLFGHAADHLPIA
jgi:hypothetical protein